MNDFWNHMPIEDAEEVVVGILHRITRWPESYTETDFHALRKIGNQCAEQALALRQRGSRSRHLERMAALILPKMGIEELPLEILRQVFEPTGGIVPE